MWGSRHVCVKTNYYTIDLKTLSEVRYIHISDNNRSPGSSVG